VGWLQVPRLGCYEQHLVGNVAFEFLDCYVAFQDVSVIDHRIPFYVFFSFFPFYFLLN
jgi:hypothetical protein